MWGCRVVGRTDDTGGPASPSTPDSIRTVLSCCYAAESLHAFHAIAVTAQCITHNPTREFVPTRIVGISSSALASRVTLRPCLRLASCPQRVPTRSKNKQKLTGTHLFPHPTCEPYRPIPETTNLFRRPTTRPTQPIGTHARAQRVSHCQIVASCSALRPCLCFVSRLMPPAPHRIMSSLSTGAVASRHALRPCMRSALPAGCEVPTRFRTEESSTLLHIPYSNRIVPPHHTRRTDLSRPDHSVTCLPNRGDRQHTHAWRGVTSVELRQNALH